ncbi:MAG TPA: hypothetical protein VFD27_08965 [Chthoniobacteraceae bacterium]|jgi:hypothetical protein|nr:hypothetical protein [Chthoniobacteraceae bacterium]
MEGYNALAQEIFLDFPDDERDVEIAKLKAWWTMHGTELIASLPSRLDGKPELKARFDALIASLAK